MRNLLFLFIISLFISCDAFKAPPEKYEIRIRGYVLTSTSNQGIPNATVRVMNEFSGSVEATVLTDAEGKYEYQSDLLRNENFLVDCKASGYSFFGDPIQLSSYDVNIVNMIMVDPSYIRISFNDIYSWYEAVEIISDTINYPVIIKPNHIGVEYILKVQPNVTQSIEYILYDSFGGEDTRYRNFRVNPGETDYIELGI